MCILPQSEKKKRRKAPRVVLAHGRYSTVVDFNDCAARFWSLPASNDHRICPEQTRPYGFTSILQLLCLRIMHKDIATVFLPRFCYIPQLYQKPSKKFSAASCPPPERQAASFYTSQSKLRSNSHKRLLLRVRLGGGSQELFHLTMIKTIINMKLQHYTTLKSHAYSRPVVLWTFRAEVFVVGGCPVHCGTVSSICGLYLLDKGSIPQSGQSKMSLETALS